MIHVEKQTKIHNLKFALLWGLFMGIVVSFIRGIFAGILVFLIEILYFLVISPILERRKQNLVKKAYREISQKMPGVTEHQLEKAVRSTIMKRQTKTAAIMFFGGAVTYMLIGPFLLQYADGVWKLILLLICLAGVIAQICSVFVFASTMHDPLTPAEAKELAEREQREKSGL